MELIRELLLAIEAQNSERPVYSALSLGVDASSEDIIYNLQLLMDANFLEAKPLKTGAGVKDIHIERMTWDGAEFLSNARNESIWKETMTLVQEKGGSVAVGILTQLLSSVAKQHFGLH
jgi:Hypothetical protein (DUF2513)